MSNLPEVWLRGPLPGIPPLLQPIAHSLLQCREETEKWLGGLSDAETAAHPGGAASVGYHIRHAVGSLDRLFTYARGKALSVEQLSWLKAEKEDDVSPGASKRLVDLFGDAVDRALQQLKETREEELTEAREVGRAKLPSTVIGLLFHAAEHTQRHLGQVATTALVISRREMSGG